MEGAIKNKLAELEIVLEEKKASLDYEKREWHAVKMDIRIIRRKEELFERTYLEEIFPRLYYSEKLKLQVYNYPNRQIEMAWVDVLW